MKITSIIFCTLLIVSCKSDLASEFKTLSKVSYDDMKTRAIESSFEENKDLIFVDNDYQVMSRDSVKVLVM